MRYAVRVLLMKIAQRAVDGGNTAGFAVGSATASRQGEMIVSLHVFRVKE